MKTNSIGTAPFYYKAPETPSRQFRVGDMVEVLDRDGNPLRTEKIIAENRRSVKTKGGMLWGYDGWWHCGRDRFPFPSIRHKKKKR